MKLGKGAHVWGFQTPLILCHSFQICALKGLSTLAENEVCTYSAYTKKHTRPIDPQELWKPGMGSDTCYPSAREDQKLKVIISYLREFEASWGHLGLCLKQTKPKPKQNSEKGERQERQEGGPSHNAKHNAGAFCLRVLFIFPTALCGEWAYSHFTSRVWEDTCNLLSTRSHKAVGGARLTEALLCPQCSWSPWFTESACVIPICILQAANAGC